MALLSISVPSHFQFPRENQKKKGSLALPIPWHLSVSGGGGGGLLPKKRRRFFAFSMPLSSPSPSPDSISGKRKFLEKRLTLRRRRGLLLKGNPLSTSISTACTSNSNNDLVMDQKQKPPWPWPWIRLILHHVGVFFRDKLWAPASDWWVRKKIPFSPKFLALPLFGVFLLVYGACTSKNTLKEVPYSELVNGIKLGHIAAVDFEEGSRCIHFHRISNEEEGASTRIRYRTRKIDRDEKFLLGLLREKDVIYRSVPPPVSRLLVSCIGTIAGLWIGVIPVIWILEKRLHGNGNRKKKNQTGSGQMVSFDDVQGVDSAKEELLEVVDCLRGTLDYKKLGAKLPSGILLVGPPGTGKTLLARAVAGEAGVPFFSVSASEFVELYVGRGAARVRELFKEARREAPAVVFIDELDAVGTERDGFSMEKDQTLNQLLTELDGFDSDKKVIILAATNRAAALDSALLRPGRFSRKVYVGEPDLEGRKKILAVHLRGVPLEEEMEVVCELVASLTEGFVGADLANIANEAALLAVRRGGSLVMREDILEAIEREKFGIKENQENAVTGSESFVKLFPWLPSLARGYVKNKNRRNRSTNDGRRILSY
ncbi:ATP-dependent zinc metalloprotease FTSH-like protein [Rhynchospora pubera]|uniref:ATP-dependent zinc metalloprotease FTSH-like protein n=1 Tax=Rhynchospora pubera TaxID=906938 RepID=A0AAV8DSH6_9POAL|nr:ATP-dependent zinc metalloprotease FTSH-like protein [Rhynchospora pubera]